MNNLKCLSFLIVFFFAIFLSFGFNKNYNLIQDIEHDSIMQFREYAKIYADSVNVDKALNYASKYIRATKDLSIINDHFFKEIVHTDAYQNFKVRYKSNFNLLSLLYLFSGFLGLFLCIMLNLKKGIKRSSTMLMSLFMVFHSLFIIHLSIYLINCQYFFPNTLLASTTFTLLYGPLIFLYFKTIISDYKLQWKDILHLIPTIGLLIYILPFYVLSSDEKFNIMFNQEDILVFEAKFIIVAKVISLCIYGFLTYKLYKENVKQEEEKTNKLLWQRNIIGMYVLYTIIFILYSTTTSGYFDFPLFFHLQIVVMVALVFYVSYISYVQPEIFKGEVKLVVDPGNIFKYKTSSLTPSYSNELKDELYKILEKEKIYKEDGVNLNMLSERLGTSRHNTSQIINEHFDMNFFELMNKFRIDEAVEMIKNKGDEKLTIIDIAYKVGFNNKVTFNKAFKKRFDVTPTQYIKSLED